MKVTFKEPSHWKQCQGTGEYRYVVCHCRDKNHVARAHLELKPKGNVRDKKKRFLKYVKSKKRIKDDIGPLLYEV